MQFMKLAAGAAATVKNSNTRTIEGSSSTSIFASHHTSSSHGCSRDPQQGRTETYVELPTDCGNSNTSLGCIATPRKHVTYVQHAAGPVRTVQLSSQRFDDVCSNPSLSLPTDSSEVSILFERYAVEHFNGRLVSGCCHLGCFILGRVSESALQTQLCSG